MVPRLSAEGRGYGLAYEAGFRDRSKPDEARPLKILLFADDSGHLSYVEADYCGNGLPAPDHMDLGESPYHVFQDDSLIRPNGTAVAEVQ